MKRAYSEYVYCKLDKLAELTPLEMLQNARESWPHMTDAERLKEIMYARSGVVIETQAKKGKCLHLFFTGEGMHDWLQSCATEFRQEQVSVIKTLIGQFGKHKPDEVFCFMLHFLGGNSPVYLCGVQHGSIIPGCHRPDKWLCVVMRGRNDSIVHFYEDADFESVTDKEIIQVTGLVSSALAYIKCFPETVINGVPADAKHPNHFRGCPAKAVGMHPSLIVRDGPNPHYRSGHFRYLESERYTKARFTTVFVHGTFVKGKSKVVLSPEDSEKEVVIL